MGNELIPASESRDLTAAIEAAATFIDASQAANTKRAYAADWRHFHTWCERVKEPALPAGPGTVVAYLSALATEGAKLSTIRRRCAAIADRHRRDGHENPAAHAVVKAAVAGMARTIGAPLIKKVALTVELLAKALRRIPDDLAGCRDRALILIGFAAALRRSELVALDLEDVARHPKGLVITVRRSKTDQAGEGKIKAIPHGRRLHVQAALDAWIARAKITQGPLFRGVRAGTVSSERLCDRQVARIVKARARATGLDAALFAGHSLRSGYITTADERGADLAKIAAHVGHTKLDTTRGYIQVADAFKHHSGKDFL